jgi:hypothetical protein
MRGMFLSKTYKSQKKARSVQFFSGEESEMYYFVILFHDIQIFMNWSLIISRRK